jgi:hypothetical protein
MYTKDGMVSSAQVGRFLVPVLDRVGLLVGGQRGWRQWARGPLALYPPPRFYMANVEAARSACNKVHFP